MFRRTALIVLTTLLLLPVPASAGFSIDADTNAQRTAYGLPALQTSSALSSLALIRAQQAVLNFDHPDNYQWMFDYIPGCEAALGENLAYYTTGAEPAGWPVANWMTSPSHRANILGSWSWQGSAILYSGTRTYAVQIFGLACQSSQAPPVAPPPFDPASLPNTALPRNLGLLLMLAGAILVLKGVTHGIQKESSRPQA